MSRTLVYLVVLFVAFSSCKKDDAFTISKETITGNYKVTAGTANGIDVYSNPNEDLNIFEPCMKDDIYRFNGNNSFIVEDAGEVCTITTAESGTWEFISSTRISINDEEATINSFNGRDLIITSVSNGVTGRFTFTKQ